MERDARISTQLVAHLPVAHVDRRHVGSPGPQEAVREAPGAGAHIERHPSPYIQAKVTQSGCQLQPAPACVGSIVHAV
ncbi:MAG: hypothetical protein AMXMBFR64_31340 [Myxococcales bacterium]